MMNGSFAVIEEAMKSLVGQAVREAFDERLSALRPVPSAPEPKKQNEPRQEPLFTVPEVAVRLHRDPGTVRQYIHTGRLVACKPVRHYLVRESDLQRFLDVEAHASRPAQAPETDTEAARLLRQLKR